MILKKIVRNNFSSKMNLEKNEILTNLEVFNKTSYCFLSKQNPIYQFISPPKYNESVSAILSSINSCKLTLIESSASSELLSETFLNSNWKDEIEVWVEYLNLNLDDEMGLEKLIANLIELENLKESLNES